MPEGYLFDKTHDSHDVDRPVSLTGLRNCFRKIRYCPSLKFFVGIRSIYVK